MTMLLLMPPKRGSGPVNMQIFACCKYFSTPNQGKKSFVWIWFSFGEGLNNVWERIEGIRLMALVRVIFGQLPRNKANLSQ